MYAMKKFFSILIDCLWVAFLVAVMAGAGMLLAQMNSGTAKSMFIFWTP